LLWLNCQSVSDEDKKFLRALTPMVNVKNFFFFITDKEAQ